MLLQNLTWNSIGEPAKIVIRIFLVENEFWNGHHPTSSHYSSRYVQLARYTSSFFSSASTSYVRCSSRFHVSAAIFSCILIKKPYKTFNPKLCDDKNSNYFPSTQKWTAQLYIYIYIYRECHKNIYTVVVRRNQKCLDADRKHFEHLL